jgi:membrane protein YdbS with pleckstrin-like domain
MFSSFSEYPQNCTFEGQDVDEKIHLLLRAHPITNLSWVVLATILIIFPIFLPILASLINFKLNNVPEIFVIVFITLNYLLVMVIVFEGFLYWYFNVTLITNLKVLDIDFEPVFYKNIDFAPLRNIEEVNSTSVGLLGTLFDFGTVYIQTAGSEVSIDLKNVPKAAQVADLIIDLKRRYQV